MVDETTEDFSYNYDVAKDLGIDVWKIVDFEESCNGEGNAMRQQLIAEKLYPGRTL